MDTGCERVKEYVCWLPFCTSLIVNMTLPDLPPWVFDRPFLTRDYVVLNRASATPAVSLGTLPLGMQEMAIVQDILTLMTVQIY